MNTKRSLEEKSALAEIVAPIVLEAITKICKGYGVSLNLILKILGINKIHKNKMELEEYLNNRIKFLLGISQDNEGKLMNLDDKMIEQWRKDAISISAKIEECRIILHMVTKPNIGFDIKKLTNEFTPLLYPDK